MDRTSGGGPPAQHCAAVALVGLKRYAEARRKAGCAGPGARAWAIFGPRLFDQAGNAWMLAGEIGKAVQVSRRR